MEIIWPVESPNGDNGGGASDRISPEHKLLLVS